MPNDTNQTTALAKVVLGQDTRAAGRALLGLVPDHDMRARYTSRVQFEACAGHDEYVSLLLEDLLENGFKLIVEARGRLHTDILESTLKADVAQQDVEDHVWREIVARLTASDFVNRNAYEEWVRSEASRDRSGLRALVRANPKAALTVLNKPGSETGLSDRGAADVLDAVVGEFGDPDEVRGEIEASVRPQRQVELLRARGDLPSSAADVVDPSVVLTAVFDEVQEAASYVGSLDDGVIDDRVEQQLTLRSWAVKLRDRDDWDEVLEMEVGSWTVFHHLLVAIFLEQRHNIVRKTDSGARYLALEEIPADLFDQVGIDPAEAVEVLQEMLDDGQMPDIDDVDVQAIRLAMGEKRKVLDAAPRTLADSEAEAAEEAADAAELDF